MDDAEEVVREATCDIIGRELTDKVWHEAYDRAQKKHRHIVTLFGDADGARNEADYLAQLAAEAVREKAIAEYTAALMSIAEASENANPREQGHMNILTHEFARSQGVFA
jgi:uncharacterized coiled-coil DUF342 family protein